jgi:hypothetical protein
MAGPSFTKNAARSLAECPEARPKARIPPEEVPLIQSSLCVHEPGMCRSHSASTLAEYSAFMPPPSSESILKTPCSNSNIGSINVKFGMLATRWAKNFTAIRAVFAKKNGSPNEGNKKTEHLRHSVFNVG